tara:strand:- start:725 stop:835 length:111 start_codon:yes stop_codon:yes gene_type:complete
MTINFSKPVDKSNRKYGLKGENWWLFFFLLLLPLGF